MVEQLQRLVDSSRVLAPNYFNGRLLTAGDLRQEREAGREFLSRVAQAVGAGVAYGFEVTALPDRQIVRVRAGLALASDGHALELDDDIDLNVIAAAPAPAVVTDGLAEFRPCQPPVAGPTAVTNPGLHLLAVGPARGAAGSVATSSLGSAAPTCSLKDDVNGLRFVLLPFRRALETKLREDDSNAAGEAGLRSRFRSRAARVCFGPEPIFPPKTHAPAKTAPVGALSTLTEPALPVCHVALALVNVAGGGVDFVDMWAARRALVSPNAAGPWGPWLDDPARTEAEVLQFQEHLASLLNELRDADALAAVKVADYFAYLPPFGIVPVVNGKFPGFDAETFFAGRVSGLFPARHLQGAGGALSFLPRIDPDAAAVLIREALHTPAAPNVEGLFLQRYLITPDDKTPEGPFPVLFTLRDTHGPIEADDVTSVLRDAADAYSAVLSRAVLMPRPITPASLLGWSALQALQLAVIYSATLDAATAAVRGLNQRDVLAAFRRLLQVQEALVAGAMLDLPDDKNQNERKERATRLNELLHVAVGIGHLGLKPSLDARPPLIPTVLFAQNEINKEVRNWTADVAVGTLVVKVEPVDSATIVPGSNKTYRFKVVVTNRATTTVRGQLRAEILRPDGGAAPQWGKPQFADEDGGGVAPTKAFQVMRGQTVSALVVLKAPPLADVPIGQEAILRVKADAAFPSDLEGVDTLEIEAGAADVPPAPRALKVAEVGTVPRGEVLSPNGRRPCMFQISCTGIAADVEVTFTAVLKCVPATPASEWRATVNDAGTLKRIADGHFEISAPLRVTVNGVANVTLRLTAPSVAPAAGTVKTCEFTVSVKLPAAGPLPEVVQSPPGNPTYSLRVNPPG